MAAIFLQKEAQEPLKNKYITAIGGTTQKSIYKDPTRPPQGSTPINDTLLRTKGEDSCPKDKSLDDGRRVRTNKGHAAEKFDNIAQA